MVVRVEVLSQNMGLPALPSFAVPWFRSLIQELLCVCVWFFNIHILPKSNIPWAEKSHKLGGRDRLWETFGFSLKKRSIQKYLKEAESIKWPLLPRIGPRRVSLGVTPWQPVAAMTPTISARFMKKNFWLSMPGNRSAKWRGNILL